jgi:hypothetical protein
MDFIYLTLYPTIHQYQIIDFKVISSNFIFLFDHHWYRVKIVIVFFQKFGRFDVCGDRVIIVIGLSFECLEGLFWYFVSCDNFVL